MKTLIQLNDGKDRASWFEARKAVDTATQAAAIAGSHPYTSVIEVWNEKTDPDYLREEVNKYLAQRAELGTAREAAIIEWASEREELGAGKLYPNVALFTSEWAPGAACTPDAYKYRRGATQPIVVDAKATEQNWNEPGAEPVAGKEAKGVPQHVYDQMQWTYYVTDAAEVWLAVEQWRWVGRGASKSPEFVERKLIKIERDENRLAFLKAKVAQFDQWLADGIAPESDLRLPDVEPDPDDFDTTPDDLEAWNVRQALERIAAIDLATADLIAEREKLVEGTVKPFLYQFEGRRIWAIGGQLVAKLVRGTRTKLDQSKLDPRAVREATSWAESQIVKIEPNPEYVPTTTTEKESK
jgi:hypothetical protein